MIPADWIEHRRTDREPLGWVVPEGDGFHVVDLLGRRRTTSPVEWLEAEELLDELGMGYLGACWVLRLAGGAQRRVRIREVSSSGIVAVADEGALVVGAHPETFALPWPAPPELRPLDPSDG